MPGTSRPLLLPARYLLREFSQQVQLSASQLQVLPTTMRSSVQFFPSQLYMQPETSQPMA